jgi:thymidylate kinase
MLYWLRFHRVNMLEHKIRALEGIDASGKSTAGKLVAAQTGSRYFYCMEGNPLAPHRKKFDTAPVPIRFLFYLAVPLINYPRLELMRQHSDVYLDRSVASTIAYHKAYGLADAWFKLIPPMLYDQLDRVIYFSVSEDERRRRMSSRSIDNNTMTVSDSKSFEFAAKIDQAYRGIFQNKTLFVETDGKKPQEVASEVITRL